ncbi:hypothetical protein JAAARDRAFT_139772, partial [Jaapia argillacea MUCL 33604]
MAAIVANRGLSSTPTDPFLSHLVALLSVYNETPAGAATLPTYHGPTSWEHENILRSLGSIVRRMHTAEETLASIKASEDWE